MKYMILLLLLIGCTTERIIYQNSTIIREIEVIKEIEIPGPPGACAECPACVVVDESATLKKLSQCNIRYDYLNDLYYTAVLNNNTEHMENLTFLYNNCTVTRNKCIGILNNITELIG